MKKAIYICFEGMEGVGKTTQTQKLADHLRSRGYKVLQTKEPGTPLSPLTMILRGIMLDKQYDDQLTPVARELISQAIRSIHMDKIVAPAMDKYDFIVQDRGVLSGLAYGSACGNNMDWLVELAHEVMPQSMQYGPWGLYNKIIYLKGDTSIGLKKALQAKQEFAAGDAMEARGNSFLQSAAEHMDMFSRRFEPGTVATIQVGGKSIDEVFSEILGALNIEE